MRLHGLSRETLACLKKLYVDSPSRRRAEFDARTFKVMSDLIKADPQVPLYFATQREYREEVSRVLPLSNKMDVRSRADETMRKA